MKHYVLGFVFNHARDRVLLIEKKRPEWQAGHWNGIGGKIKLDEKPIQAMYRECCEETSIAYDFEHVLTFVCPGGTVFVFRAFATNEYIEYDKREDEDLKTWLVDSLPEKVMNNLKWIIPVCLSTLKFPFAVEANTLGVES